MLGPTQTPTSQFPRGSHVLSSFPLSRGIPELHALPVPCYVNALLVRIFRLTELNRHLDSAVSGSLKYRGDEEK